MNTKNIIIILLSALLLSCSGDYLPEQNDELVVEGWIEDNGFPVVILSKNINISNRYQPLDSLSGCIVKWAKVTVSDGTRSVVLTGRYTKGYMPPYIYYVPLPWRGRQDLPPHRGVRQPLCYSHHNHTPTATHRRDDGGAVCAVGHALPDKPPL